MSESWYEVVGAETLLTQGDVIFDCPLLTWNTADLPQETIEVDEGQEPKSLRKSLESHLRGHRRRLRVESNVPEWIAARRIDYRKPGCRLP